MGLLYYGVVTDNRDLGQVPNLLKENGHGVGKCCKARLSQPLTVKHCQTLSLAILWNILLYMLDDIVPNSGLLGANNSDITQAKSPLWCVDKSNSTADSDKGPAGYTLM